MRRLLFTIGFVLLLSLTVFAEFHRLVSITGGSGQRLTTALATAGYTGGDHVDELIICTPSGSANTMYLGHISTVNASTGFPIPAGTCERWRAAGRNIDMTSYYLFVATTQNAAISIRSR
jgi:hypothetical protein